MKKNVIHTEKAPAAVGPYSQAVSLGKLIFTAGQIPIDPALGKLIEGDIPAQTEQVMKNLQAILEAAGTGLHNIVKTTVFLQDMADFAAMNAVYAKFFDNEPPARSTVAVAALPLGAQLEIEAIATIPA